MDVLDRSILIKQQASELPIWLKQLLQPMEIQKLLYDKGILRLKTEVSSNQEQTKEAFGFKWKKKETFESPQMLTRMREWLNTRYGDINPLLAKFKNTPIVLDAGCGAGMSALEYWRDYFDKIHYLGVDVSTAVDVCRERFSDAGIRNAAFMQADISHLPFKEESIDIIFSEGVMHHTDSTYATFKTLSQLLKPQGLFMFYIYNKKGPIREFVDDYIRHQMKSLSPVEAWEAMKPLTQLGKLLGELDIVINIPEKIDLLDIPAGEINLQRLFYWHIFKAYYHPDLDMIEMNHINYDWYAPLNAHRHSIEEVSMWCQQGNFKIIRECVEPSGITLIAMKN